MSEREDRIVYVCGCRGESAFDEATTHQSPAAGLVCRFCRQPVQAVNIDRLLRLEERMQHMPADMCAHNCDGSCADWDAECGGGCDE
jgi:hypothetical protein